MTEGLGIRRRGFLGAILAAAMAPAIVRASSIMKVAAPVEELPGHPLPSTDDYVATESGVLAPGVLAPGHNLRIGDIITIAAAPGRFYLSAKDRQPQRFVVTGVASCGFDLERAEALSPSIIAKPRRTQPMLQHGPQKRGRW